MATKKRKITPKSKSKAPEDLWQEQPSLIKTFIEKRPDFEQLCAEVAYILTKKLKQKAIETSTVNWRAKTLTSFIENLRRSI